MPEYIEREKLQEHFKSVVSKHEVVINGMVYPVYLCDHTLHEIRNAPTEDVVKVVRCMDCKYITDKGICEKFRQRYPFFPEDDFYCGYGELKEREG